MKTFKIKYQIRVNALVAMGALFFVSACNKSLPVAEPIEKPALNTGATQTLGEKISTDPGYTIYHEVVKRTPGLLARLNDPKNELTVLAPDNEAFIRSGIPAAAAIGTLPAQTVAAIGMYSVIPGRQYLSASVPATFPNVQLPTLLKIGDLPGTPLPLQMTTFLSGANGFWVNNIPIAAADQKFKNGVIHNPYAMVAPPSKVLKDMIFADPDLTYYKAALARADSAQTGTGSFEYLLGYAVTNMTVLVPNNAAFQELLFGSVYAHLLGTGMDAATAQATATSLTSTPAVFENPALFPVLTAATVRGILAYHFLASEASGYQPSIRVFSNNFNKTPTHYKTLVNGSIAVHPGILVTPTYTGPAVSNITFTGMGTFPPGGAPYSGTPGTAVSKDNHGVNGVYYVIDKVLMPQ